ncbi:MAG: hypothetical protein WCA35_20630 [Kovacikia sp.]
MHHPQSSQANGTSRLTKFTILMLEAAIATAVVGIFALSNQTHVGTVTQVDSLPLLRDKTATGGNGQTVQLSLMPLQHSTFH